MVTVNKILFEIKKKKNKRTKDEGNGWKTKYVFIMRTGVEVRLHNEDGC